MDFGQNRREALAAMLAAGGLAGRASRAWSEETCPIPGDDPAIRALFFNTHLLPAIAQSVAGHRGQDNYRAGAIAAQLHRYDLVGLCEVFESRRRREIVRIMQENSERAFHWVESPRVWGRHLTGSGLLLLTRLAIEGEPHFLTYRSASRVLTNAWKADGFAAKGVIHARLRFGEEPGMLADCFLTHLESVSSKARQAQIKELADFIATHCSPERPLILMGDMNIVADHPWRRLPTDRSMASLRIHCGTATKSLSICGARCSEGAAGRATRLPKRTVGASITSSCRRRTARTLSPWSQRPFASNLSSM